MTTSAPHSSEPDDLAPDPKKPTRDGPPARKPLPDAKPSPLFKIVPADPKNNFDFEDVADK